MTGLRIDEGERTLAVITPQLDALIEAWEATSCEAPDLREFVPEVPELQRLTLIELIKVDLEYRYLERSLPKRIDEYASEFPELADGGIPIDLVHEEIHLRRQCGLHVDIPAYCEAYPEHAAELKRLVEWQPDATKTQTAGARRRRLSKFEPGQQLDDFDLLAELGQGAFAKVMLARQCSMQRLVALKIASVVGNEPRTLAQFDHEQIVRVFDQRALPQQGVHLLYMQYLPGGTLQQIIRRVQATPVADRSGMLFLEALRDALRSQGESLERESIAVQQLEQANWPETVCWIGIRLAEGLQYAHRQGVLHRDIKPANVLLSRQGTPKLADFNISFHAGLSGTTPAAYFGGSLAYMSPEQLEACDEQHSRTPEELDERSDLYSLGVVLWELLTGGRPFGDETVLASWAETLRATRRSREAGPTSEAKREAATDESAGLPAVLQRCLMPKPEQRWQSAGQLARQLNYCLDAELQQLLNPRESSWTRRLARHPVAAVAIAVVTPNALAGVFNLVYNRDMIVSQLGTSQLVFFDRIQATINLVAYPSGLALVAYLAWTVARAMQVRLEYGKPTSGAPKRIRHRCLRLGQWAAFIGLVEWVLAGFAYPIAMRLATDSFPWNAAVHFWNSLVLCGLIAASYPFFAITCLSLRTQYPRLLGDDPELSADRPMFESLKRNSWKFLALALAVPFLAVLLLAATQTESPVALLGISGVSLVGVIPLLMCFQRLQADLATLLRHARPKPRAGSSLKRVPLKDSGDKEATIVLSAGQK